MEKSTNRIIPLVEEKKCSILIKAISSLYVNLNI